MRIATSLITVSLMVSVVATLVATFAVVDDLDGLPENSFVGCRRAVVIIADADVRYPHLVAPSDACPIDHEGRDQLVAAGSDDEYTKTMSRGS